MIDFDQCSCAGCNLDKLIQPIILVFLAEEDLHGYGLIQKMTNSPMLTGEKPDPTGVYRSLKSMEDRSLVISSWDFREPGPPKKTYRITAQGLACLERWIATLHDYGNSIQALIIRAEPILNRPDPGKLIGNRNPGPDRETTT